MNTAWPNASLASGSQFNGLYDELLSFDLPAAKPQPTPTVQEGPPVTVEQLTAVEMNKKRKLEMAEKESLEIFLAQLGSEEAGTALMSDTGLGMKRKDSGDKDAKLDTARNKACRERARRERLNDSFAELSKALDPRKDVKTDKTSIVADAIRVVTQLRAENGQLKQLNKFLEERVGTVEKQKADLMLQQAFLQQQANGAGPSAAPQLPQQPQQGMQNAFGVAPGVPVGHFNQQPAPVMQFMGLSSQNGMSMGIPPQQAIGPGIAAGMMQHGMQSIPSQGLQPQALHGDVMMQQHTHGGNVNDQIDSALNFDGTFSAHDLLEDGFPSFPSPALDSQSSSGQQQQADQSTAQRAASNSNSSQRQQAKGKAAGLAKNPSLQRNMRKLAVNNNRGPSVSTPDDMFSSAMQSAQAQMQMSASIPMVGPGSWLSPSILDTSQDSIRRPPAA